MHRSLFLRRQAWQLFFFVVLIILLVGCASPAVVTPTAASEPTMAATEIVLPTATQAATATAQPTATTQPTATATPTMVPTATATPIPPLAILTDGFFAWCNPQEYAGVNAPGAIAPEVSRKSVPVKDGFKVGIPAEFCTLVYTLNQPAAAGMLLKFYQGSDNFLTLDLKADAEHPEMVFAAVKHSYVVNPPFWEVTYRAAVVNAEGKEIRSDLVTFARALPANCPYGGLPDPVTLACAAADPWEIEPHLDVTPPWPTFTPQP